MEIQAKLTFKHGRIMRVLAQKNMTVKSLAKLADMEYQNILNFVSFKSLIANDRDKLFSTLKTLDPTITYEEVFPAKFKEIAKILHPRISNKDIPIESLLPYDESLHIEYNDPSFENIEMREEWDILLDAAEWSPGFAYDKRAKEIISSYYGFNGEPKTLAQIAKKFKVTPELICKSRNRALRRLYRDKRIQCLAPKSTSHLKSDSWFEKNVVGWAPKTKEKVFIGQDALMYEDFFPKT